MRTINSTCANPKGTWIGKMQSVQWPTAAQLEILRASSLVCEEKVPLQWLAGEAALQGHFDAI